MEIRGKDNYQKCQIVTLPQLCEPISFLTRWWQFRNRLRRIFKRRWIYLVNLSSTFQNTPQLCCGDEPSHYKIVRGEWLKKIFQRGLIPRWKVLDLLSGKGKIIITSREEANFKAFRLEPGDLVRVKSREEIKKSLDTWNQMKGCSFTEEMWPYCGTTQKVLKRVEKFLDERDYLMKKCKKIVILDGVFCGGTKDFGPCDRTCFFFWREEWLDKIDEAADQDRKE